VITALLPDSLSGPQHVIAVGGIFFDCRVDGSIHAAEPVTRLSFAATRRHGKMMARSDGHEDYDSVSPRVLYPAGGGK
jgi:hypothetical protein